MKQIKCEIDKLLLPKRDYKEFDMVIINAILENVSHQDYIDCKRLLIRQTDNIIEQISYLIYDKNGEENDFIPIGCKYEHFVAIILATGGKEETFSDRKEREARKIINKYQLVIKHQIDIIRKLKETSSELSLVKFIKGKFKRKKNIASFCDQGELF